jgi:hypothetical protein
VGCYEVTHVHIYTHIHFTDPISAITTVEYETSQGYSKFADFSVQETFTYMQEVQWVHILFSCKCHDCDFLHKLLQALNTLYISLFNIFSSRSLLMSLLDHSPWNIWSFLNDCPNIVQLSQYEMIVGWRSRNGCKDNYKMGVKGNVWDCRLDPSFSGYSTVPSPSQILEGLFSFSRSFFLYSCRVGWLVGWLASQLALIVQSASFTWVFSTTMIWVYAKRVACTLTV